MSAPGPSTDARPKSRWADLAPRLGSAAVIVAVAAIALYFGGWVFAALMAAVFGVLYREWDQMLTLKPLAAFGMALIAIVAVAALAYPLWGLAGTLVVMALAIVVSLFGGRAFAAWRAGGLVFFAIVMVAALAMRGTTPLGNYLGWYLGLVIAFNDSGAFFAGRVVGGPKLAPTISPAKTWSGAIGGLITGAIAGTIFWVIFTHSPLWLGAFRHCARADRAGRRSQRERGEADLPDQGFRRRHSRPWRLHGSAGFGELWRPVRLRGRCAPRWTWRRRRRRISLLVTSGCERASAAGDPNLTTQSALA